MARMAFFLVQEVIEILSIAYIPFWMHKPWIENDFDKCTMCFVVGLKRFCW